MTKIRDKRERILSQRLWLKMQRTTETLKCDNEHIEYLLQVQIFCKKKQSKNEK